MLLEPCWTTWTLAEPGTGAWQAEEESPRVGTFRSCRAALESQGPGCVVTVRGDSDSMSLNQQWRYCALVAIWCLCLLQVAASGQR